MKFYKMLEEEIKKQKALDKLMQIKAYHEQQLTEVKRQLRKIIQR